MEARRERDGRRDAGAGLLGRDLLRAVECEELLGGEAVEGRELADAGGEAGRHHLPGPDRERGDAGVLELGRERVRELDLRGLHRLVRPHVRAADGAEAHEHAALALDHRGHRELRQDDRSADVHAVAEVPVLERRLRERAERRDRRVVHHDVDRRELGRDALHERRERRLVADVRADERRGMFAEVLVDEPLGLGAGHLVDLGDDDVRAEPRESAGGLHPDASAGAGDDGDAGGEHPAGEGAGRDERLHLLALGPQRLGEVADRLLAAVRHDRDGDAFASVEVAQRAGEDRGRRRARPERFLAVQRGRVMRRVSSSST